ncbi:hypothetical protein L596_030944 [Steinernema carpocapsae]|uniref:SSD domain-containing protein n=1 Tax=Steinernema carpocapsae TaxID=34508 RepID=A0A4U5MHC4_STECR|nr:hypothetical protein L596_030944 [Steinernema carpocapsae]
MVGYAVYDFKGLNQGNQTLEMFLPDDMQSLKDLHLLIKLFPPRDALRDSYSLFGSKFAYVIYEDHTQPEANVLSPKTVRNLADLHKRILEIRDKKKRLYSDICLRGEGEECAKHPIFLALEDDQPMFILPFLTRYPMLKISNVTIDNAVIFGNVTVKPELTDKNGNAPILHATALRLVYVLAPDLKDDDWLRQFVTDVSQLQYPNASLYISTSCSLPDEMERNGALLIPWIPWMVVVLLGFCMVVCSSTDAVRSQPFIGISSMLNASLAVITACATLIILRYPFLHMILIMPFLVISIGTDNMFLMLKSWRLLENRKIPTDERLTEAITEVSVSLMITSLTDGLSFSVGSTSDFLAVRVFCTYCALSILYMFLFQMTFLMAIMVLHCRREVAGRHWLFMVKLEDEKESDPLWMRWLCRNRPIKSSHKEESSLVYERISRILNQNPIRFLVLFIYIVYLSLSVNWILQFPLGLDLKTLAPDESFAADELRAQERLFSDYGAFCFAVIHTKNVHLHDAQIRYDLLDFYHNLTNSGYASKGDFWLDAYEKMLDPGIPTIQKPSDFMKTLIKFLEQPQYKKYRSDIQFNATGHIEAIKIIMRIRKRGPQNDAPRAAILRNRLEKSGFEGFVYDTSFLIVDQQSVTVSNVISNVVLAIFVMLLISILLIPRPASAFSIALSILSINIGVVGALAASGTRLDIISMITIVMSIGFSVDYATHVTFHYLIQRTDRLKKSLEVMVYPITQAALSTAIGVSILGIVPSYMIRTFVLTVVYVVIIGLLHALLFLPVLLSVVVPDSEYLVPYKPHFGSKSPRRSLDVSRRPTPSNSRMKCYRPEHIYALPP